MKKQKKNNMEESDETSSNMSGEEPKLEDLKHFPEFLPEISSLRPRLDQIFADVQSSLPIVNFDTTDLSSEDDFQIFRRPLKESHSSSEDEENEKDDDGSIGKTKCWFRSDVTEFSHPLSTVQDKIFSNGETQTDSNRDSGCALDSNRTLATNLQKSSRNCEDVSDTESLKKENLNKNGPLCEEQDCLSSEFLDSGRDLESTAGSQSQVEDVEHETLDVCASNSSKKNSPGIVAKTLVASLFPSKSWQLTLDLDNIPTNLARPSFSHGDNAELYPNCSTGELSLMEKLAQFSQQNSATEKPTDNKEAICDCPNNFVVSQSSCGVNTSEQTMSTSTIGTSTKDLKKSQGTVKSLKNNTRDSTVFIDLRPSVEDHQEKQRKEREKRIFGVEEMKCDSSESSDDSDDDQNELWFEQRHKIKNLLNTGQLPPKKLKKDKPSKKIQSNLEVKPTGATKPVKHVPLQRLAGYLSDSKPSLTELQAPSHHIANLLKKERCSVLPSDVPEESKHGDFSERKVTSKDNVVCKEAQTTKQQMAETIRKEKEKIEQERNKRLRLQERLENLKPGTSFKGKQPCAEATDILFDSDASYEAPPSVLPDNWADLPECSLLTIPLFGHGQLSYQSGNVRKTADPGPEMSGSYNALVTWLTSLVPDDLHDIRDESLKVPFRVIAMQQMSFDGQLVLNIVITPAKIFGNGEVHKSKKSQKDLSPFNKEVLQFLTKHNLLAVCPWLTTSVGYEMCGTEHSFTYKPPFPRVSQRPLSSLIQLHTDLDAIRRNILVPIGFFWETIDTDELLFEIVDTKDLDSIVNSEKKNVENILMLMQKNIYRDPCSMSDIMNRILQEGLCISGLRLLYPPTDSLTMISNIVEANLMKEKIESLSKSVDPILAMVLRGPFASKVWLGCFGPQDPALARRTDPLCLNALYGGEFRSTCLFFCPRTPNRNKSEIARWFGARVPQNGVIDLGESNFQKAEVRKNKKRKNENLVNKETLEIPPSKPAALLTASTKSDIFLVISTLVPAQYFGVVLFICQQRGYSVQGVKRLKLNRKKALQLGLNDVPQMSAFLGSFCSDTMDDQNSFHSDRPVTIFLLNNENARYLSASLIEELMVQMALCDILGFVKETTGWSGPLSSQFFFLATPYSSNILCTLGGDFTKLPVGELCFYSGSMNFSRLYSNPEMEQIVIVAICKKQGVLNAGHFLANLLGLLPKSKKYGDVKSFETRFELLGLKWLSSISMSVAKDLTPYEVGNREWRKSVQALTSEPAFIIAVRGINAIKRIESIVCKSSSSIMQTSVQLSLENIMSRTPEMAYHLAKIFFSEDELFSDNKFRELLPYLPESIKDERRDTQPVVDPDQPNIFHEMLKGPQPFTTFLLVKPDAVHRIGSVLRRVRQEKFVVVAMRLEMLTKEFVKQFLDPAMDQYELNLSHLCQDKPCLLLALQRENAVKKLIDLLGPTDPVHARGEGEYCWRAIFGISSIANGLYCSGSYKQSIADQKIAFPSGLCCMLNADLKIARITCPAIDNIIDLNHTKTRDIIEVDSNSDILSNIKGLVEINCVLLAPILVRPLIKSNMLPFVEIIEHLLHSGFLLVGCRMIWLTSEQAEYFLQLNKQGSFEMVSELTSGPSIVLALQRDAAILSFQNYFASDMGKDSICSQYYKDIHHAKDTKQASKLLTFFFNKLTSSARMQIIPSSSVL